MSERRCKTCGKLIKRVHHAKASWSHVEGLVCCTLPSYRDRDGKLTHAEPEVLDTDERCKHCGLAIFRVGTHPEAGWRHLEGPQRNLHRCAINPYGFNACPPNEPCDFTCNAYRGIEVSGE